MSRAVATAVLLAIASPALAEDAADVADAEAEDRPAVAAQEIGAQLGLTVGGRTTPGGLRVAGHYLYQLTATDWFDGTVVFVFGGGDAACFRDRQDQRVCDHGRTDGFSGGAEVAVRRFFATAGGFSLYGRAGLGVRVAAFSSDEVSGLAIPLLVGAGARTRVAPTVAVGAQAGLELGVGFFGSGLGNEPQAGASVIATVDFALE